MSHDEGRASFDVSVIIPAYNIGDYIGRAIDSVLAQTVAPREIIVVDDGSTDNTAAIAAAYGERVRLIRQDNRGLAGARNAGIRAAGGQWLAFLDGDDEWLPEWVARQAAVVARHPELHWSTGNFYKCLCDDNRRGPQMSAAEMRRLLQGRDWHEDYLALSAARAGGHPNTMLVRREVFEQVGYFDETRTFAVDLGFWWQIAYRYPRVGYVAAPIAVYHLTRPGTITQTHWQRRGEMLAALMKEQMVLARQAGRQDGFAPVVRTIISDQLRGCLFRAEAAETARALRRDFRGYLRPGIRWAAPVLLLWPGVTAAILRALSRLVRRMGWRRRVVRRP